MSGKSTKSVRQRLVARSVIGPETYPGLGPCFLWTGALNQPNGYGQFYRNRKHLTLHRAAYEEFVGSIPPGLFVLHRCDRKTCWRPDHLYLGTQQDNIDDMCTKGRHFVGPLPLPGKHPKGDHHWTRLYPERRLTGDRHWRRRSLTP